MNLTTNTTSIFDLYIEKAGDIANKIIVEYADIKVHKNENNYTEAMLMQKYISDFVFKDSLIEQHYQLVGHLSLSSKNKNTDSNLLMQYFMLDNISFSSKDYDNTIDCVDDIILNIVYKIMEKLINKEIKINMFK